MKITWTNSELLELVRRGFCVETAEQSVLSGISCQIRNSDSFHDKEYPWQQYQCHLCGKSITEVEWLKVHM